MAAIGRAAGSTTTAATITATITFTADKVSIKMLTCKKRCK